MSQFTVPSDNKVIECLKCGIVLEKGKVEVAYMDSKFPVDLLRCPKCGLVYIPEELVTGKMQEVERALEDK